MSFAVPPVVADDAEPWVRDQARQIRDALLLARCQPHVGAFFNFELLDEDRLAGWQSGVLWRDGTHKPSYDAFRDAVAARRVGPRRLLDRARCRRPDPADRGSRQAHRAHPVTSRRV